MRLEIPECRRCCGCVPLRHGVLVFGYLNLLFSFFIVALETFVIVKYRARGYTSNNTVTIFKGVSFYTHIWFAILLYAAEIIFNIILLVGAHTVCSYYSLAAVLGFAHVSPYYPVLGVNYIMMAVCLLPDPFNGKKTHLIRAYYYYGITTTLATLVTFIVLWLNTRCMNCYWSQYVAEVCFVLSGIGIQVYLLLLIRSELLKIRQSSRLCYVNHAAEMVVDTPIQTGQNPF